LSLDSIYNNKEIILTAVKRYGEALKYASEEIKNDETIVNEVSNPGLQLKPSELIC